MPRLIRLWLALSLFALEANAQDPAARLARDSEPVEMSAEGRLRVDLKNHRGTAEKNVVIRRRDVIVCCDRAEATYDGDRIQRVECRGRVVIARPDGTRARADVAVFEASEDKLTLKGKARVRAPSADLEGDTITYDVREDQLEVTGGPSRFRFKPKDTFVDERPCPP
ncbi:MAG: hypothetical protein HYV07_18570 [Deltaproteobacteria bacterium]|nr:hypothetical protein [Deltaproteobacteria bacterium]